MDFQAGLANVAHLDHLVRPAGLDSQDREERMVNQEPVEIQEPPARQDQEASLVHLANGVREAQQVPLGQLEQRAHEDFVDQQDQLVSLDLAEQ